MGTLRKSFWIRTINTLFIFIAPVFLELLKRFHFECVLEQYDEIMYNPFSRKARWRRAIIRKLRELELEIGGLNYKFHGDESFPNPVYLMDKIEDDNRF